MVVMPTHRPQSRTITTSVACHNVEKKNGHNVVVVVVVVVSFEFWFVLAA